MTAQKHRMIVGEETDSGIRWDCPICGRSILFSQGGMKTLNSGDFRAQHSGMTARKHPGTSLDLSSSVSVQLPDPDAPPTC